MKFKTSPESAIRCIKFFVNPIVCWPPPLSATKSDLIIRDILWIVAIFGPVIILYPLIFTIRESRDDMTRVTKTLSTLIAVTFAIIKMIMCRYHRTHFQIFCAELDEFIKKANQRERAILERYMDRCGPFYASVIILTLSTYCCYSMGPVILPQPLPADVDFPFSYKDSPKLLVFLYIVEVLLGGQSCSAVGVDIEIALLLWFSGIQFELLAEEFTRAENVSEFNLCIQKHQKLLASAQKLVSTIRYTVLAVTTVTALGNISTGYQFVHHQPIAVLAQFIFMLSVMSMEVLMYAWPADNLMSASENIAYAVYSSPWFGKSPEMLKSFQIVMLRAQRPVVVSIDGILPKLGLEFYGTYLITSFSYITTLQAVFG